MNTFLRLCGYSLISFFTILICNVAHARDVTYTGTINRIDNTHGVFTIPTPVPGVVKSFSASFHTNADCSQDERNCYLCSNHGGQGNGYLNGQLISRSALGPCGMYISDMAFSNSNMYIPAGVYQQMTFIFDGYAGSPWDKSEYTLVLEIQDSNCKKQDNNSTRGD